MVAPDRTDVVGKDRTGPGRATKGRSVPGRAEQDLAAPGMVSRSGQPPEGHCWTVPGSGRDGQDRAGQCQTRQSNKRQSNKTDIK